MKEVIGKILGYMIENPVLRILIEDELNRYYYALNPNQQKKLNKQLLKGVNMSELKITSDHRLILPGFGSKEICVNNIQAKTLYIFYLLLPHGVSNEDIVKYKKVLENIYGIICPFKSCDSHRMESVIEGMLVREGGISDAVNKIRKALKEVIDDEDVYNQYVVCGKRKKERYVSLPKYKIIVECDKLIKIKAELNKINIIRDRI